MSEFTSEGSQAADEEVEYVRSEPTGDPLSEPGAPAEQRPAGAAGDEEAAAADAAAGDQQD